MSSVIFPNLYIAAVEKSPANIKPNIYISSVDFRAVAIADTLRIVDNKNVATADTLRRLVESTIAKTLRQIVRTNFAIADTIIRHPHNLIFTPAVNTFKDYHITDFSVSLNERTLSDTFNLQSAIALNINDAVKGQFLDYPFSFLVEETIQRDLIQTINGMYDLDKLLYTHIEHDFDNASNPTAEDFITKIAGYFNLTPDIKFENFTPYNVIGNSNITYSDLISSLFSWTSRLPHRQINVFIRGNTLHCVQREFEDKVFDISNLPHSRPTITKKFLRTMYNNPFGSSNFETENVQVPFSGTIRYSDSYSYTEITYSNGLLISERSETANSKVESTTSTDYEYFSESAGDNRVFYLRSKHTVSETITNESVEVITFGHPKYDANAIKVTSDISTDYIYSKSDDGKYLFCENEQEIKSEYYRSDINWALEETTANERKTFHHPLGNGWYSTTVYVNGEHQGSSISQGKPDNSVSLYTTTKSMQKTKSDNPNDYDAARSRLAAIADISFPVRELDLIRELTDDLLWLNRKTQESVTLDLFSQVVKGLPVINHVVDFTERVILNGSVYFLVSNQINLTPNSFIQKLHLVRWY